MRKIIAVLLAAACITGLSSCVRIDITPSVEDGMYVNDNDALGAYIYLWPESRSWQSSAGAAFSYAISGEYEIQGSRLVLTAGCGIEMETILEILPGHALKVISVQTGPDTDPALFNWIREGDVFTLVRPAQGGQAGQIGQAEDAGQTGVPAEELFDTVCGADEALRLSKASDTVVMEDLRCTSGKEVWDRFYETAMEGTPASVLCAFYYTLDKEHTSEELYEEEKDNYPMLFFLRTGFDGEKYTVTTRKSSEAEPESQETYQYLLHDEGDMVPSARFRHFDYYFLADAPDLTYEDIMHGVLSSQWGDFIPHCTLYQDLFN